MNFLNSPLDASTLSSKRMNGVVTHEFLLVYSWTTINLLFLVSRLSIQFLYRLSHWFFYQAPVELETVEDGTLLGLTIDTVQQTIRYQVPPLWKIGDLQSAGSMRLRLSGLRFRATLIRRCTFPKRFVSDDLNQLLQLYVQKGFSEADCQRGLYRRQFKHN